MRIRAIMRRVTLRKLPWGLVLVAGVQLIALSSWGAGGEPATRGLPRWLRLSRVPLDPPPATSPSTTKPVGKTSQRPLEPSTQPSPGRAKQATSPVSSPMSEPRVIQTVAAEVPEPIVPPTPVPDPTPEPTTNPIAPAPETLPTAEEARAAAELAGLTLEMLTSLADTHHPRLTTAYQGVQAARGRAWQAGLYPNPVVSAASPQIDGNESQYNGFVEQEIVTAKKLKLDVAAIEREVSQANCAWQQVRLELLTQLRIQFYETLAAQTRAQVLESLVKTLRRSKEVAERLLMAGEGTKGDVLLFEIEVERAEVALANTRTVFELGLRQLAILAAVPDLEIEQLAGDLNLALRDYDPTELRFTVASVHPQANIARLEIDRRAYRLQRARVEPIPNIGMMAGAQRQVGIPAENQGLFQVSVAVPLWNKNQGHIFAAEADLAGSRADLQRVELDLSEQATEALTNYQTAARLVARYDEQILPKARETLQISQNLYAQGQIDFLRLLQSQKTLLEAELARIDAQEQRWVAAALIAGLLQQDVFP